MAYHIGNLGAAGRHVAGFADLRGMVPQAGDTGETFEYPSGYWMDDSEWAQWCRDADAATDAAHAEIDAFNGVTR